MNEFSMAAAPAAGDLIKDSDESTFMADVVDASQDVPVIVVTAKTLSRDELAHLQGHVEDVLHKSGRTIDSLLVEVSDKIQLHAMSRLSTD